MNRHALVRAMIAGIAIVPLVALGQGTAGGTSGSPADGTAAQGGAPAATSAPAQSAQPASVSTATSAPAQGGAGSAATSGSQAPRPLPAATQTTNAVQPAQSVQQVATQTPPMRIDDGAVPADDGPNLLVRAVEALLVLIPFGFIAAYFLRKKPKPETEEEQTKKRCFDIEQMLKDKLNELTDLRAMAADKATDMGKELIRDLVTGTKTGDLLVRIEKMEEEYNKLKALFEECKVDADHYRYKGVLIENSLLDKEVLDEVRVINTRTEGDWVVHDIRLSEAQIETIQRNIAEKKWYFHLWQPGNDEVTVVFKDALFKIKHSDKRTWQKAIAHGIECGIPEDQLDFPVV